MIRNLWSGRIYILVDELFLHTIQLVSPVLLGALIHFLVTVIEESNQKVHKQNMREQHEEQLEGNRVVSYPSLSSWAIHIRPPSLRSLVTLASMDGPNALKVRATQHLKEGSKEYAPE